MVTLAPERDPTDTVVPFLAGKGIVVSAGHTAATYEQLRRAVDQGATMITHVFNAQPMVHHRAPGVLGVLSGAGKKPWFGIIADGVHVHPSFLRIAWEAHPRGMVLVTDAMRVLGLRDGRYEWTNGATIVKKDGRVTLGDGDTIAGSCVELLQCVSNFVKWTGAGIAEGVRTVTESPAALLGLEGVKGCLKVGADADLVVLEEREGEWRAREVWKFGVRVYGEGEKAKL